ncbi:hypothetical protein [Streptomyces pseudovenezuelae]|uniref:Uncharacterized protein n=1 Tax=Streptomyces pseudovenezuelae TaxID=67350 RepID=A0ABT6LYK3_9ACTN|nr:hypothetical protein [Streptomyces pseudovenezuelae]MDH6221387.1 hypothetical protein [Streptomyces pseudovenezuelae]
MPTATNPVGRLLLERAITLAAQRAAAPGNLRFTERQLYYETCRVLRPTPAPVRRIPYSPAPPLRLSRFTEVLRGAGWAAELPGLLPAPVPGVPTIGGPAREPDLYDYALPRLLICQNRAIARMLLANHVHLEAACPVLSAEDDLPLDSRLVAGLERAGGATVHVLHDASPAGIALPGRVREGLGSVSGRVREELGSTPVRVVSLGLVPRHAQTLRLVAGRRPRPLPPLGPLPPGLRPAEVDWLAAGRFAEVAAVPPAKLLRAVLRLTRGPRPTRHSVWGELRGLRTAGFMTWPDA